MQSNAETISSIESNDFFEGVEKLLEIWFGRSSGVDDNDHVISVGTGSVDVIRRSSDGEEDDKSGDDEMEDMDGNKRLMRRDGDLRRIPKKTIQDMLALVKCEIISETHSDHIDAYVLSESSLFVSRNRIILKTCGSTVLLRCVKPFLYLAKKYAGFDQVRLVAFDQNKSNVNSDRFDFSSFFAPISSIPGVGRVLFAQKLYASRSAGKSSQLFQL